MHFDWPLWIERLGFPIALLVVIGYALKKTAEWLAPHLTAWLNANTERQKVMADNQTRLTEKCIEIQQSNSDTLKSHATTLQSLHEKFDAFAPCRYPMTHRARSRKKTKPGPPPTAP